MHSPSARDFSLTIHTIDHFARAFGSQTPLGGCDSVNLLSVSEH